MCLLDKSGHPLSPSGYNGFRLLVDIKSPDIIFWSGEVCVFDQTRVAINQIKEVSDTRAGSDEMVSSSLAVCLLIKNGFTCQGTS
jgi:hypothetical protein